MYSVGVACTFILPISVMFIKFLKLCCFSGIVAAVFGSTGFLGRYLVQQLGEYMYFQIFLLAFPRARLHF